MLKSEWKILKYQIIVIITLYCQFIIIPKSLKVFCLLFLSKVTLSIKMKSIILNDDASMNQHLA